jgi:hypothetical protein
MRVRNSMPYRTLVDCLFILSSVVSTVPLALKVQYVLSWHHHARRVPGARTVGCILQKDKHGEMRDDPDRKLQRGTGESALFRFQSVEIGWLVRAGVSRSWLN